MEEQLVTDGWKFIEKDIFTGKPTWVKNEIQHNGWISYKFYLTLNDYQNISTIRFSGGEFSTVQRAIETIQQVRDFVKVLE